MRWLSIGLIVAMSAVACGNGRMPALETVELDCEGVSLGFYEGPAGASAEEAAAAVATGIGTPSLVAESDGKSLWEVYDDQRRLVAAISIEEAPDGEFVSHDQAICGYVYDRVFGLEEGRSGTDVILDCEDPEQRSYAPPLPGNGAETEADAVLRTLAGTSLGVDLSDVSLEPAVGGVLARNSGGDTVGYAATGQHPGGDWFVSLLINC